MAFASEVMQLPMTDALPVASTLEVRCDYNNLKASIALKFASLDYKDWETYEPRAFRKR